jgi:NDP-sugar pyrophosphorylase family protein
MKAVILAGGKGTRLEPYTTVFPKPLMPIGDKPILEIVIHQLKSHGFNEIIMAVGHLAELIMAFFNDGSKYCIKIKYSREDHPMGTAGPLASMKKDLNETFLMMNGDILSTIDYSDLVNYHKKNKAIATIALNKRDMKIDFGIVEMDDRNAIKNYIEKPTIDYLVSMGIYVFEPEILEYVTPNEKLDFPDLIKQLISNGEEVKGYVYDGYWLDIGRPDDYEKANREIGEISLQLFESKEMESKY